jgi:aspartate/methionine/tyrosine aminotransferase
MGASETLMLALMGTLNEGDEVILFEPYFDIYVP